MILFFEERDVPMESAPERTVHASVKAFWHPAAKTVTVHTVRAWGMQSGTLWTGENLTGDNDDPLPDEHRCGQAKNRAEAVRAAIEWADEWYRRVARLSPKKANIVPIGGAS